MKYFSTPIYTILMVLFFAISAMAEPISLTYNTNLAVGKTIELPLMGTVNVSINWGDGSAPQLVTSTGKVSHEYASEGIYTVTIDGNLTQLGNSNIAGIPVGADLLDSVGSFGDIGLTSLAGAFIGASNLRVVPNTLPTGIIDLSVLFHKATNFNQDLSNWNTSEVTNLYGIFAEASSFDQDLSSWDVSAVTDFTHMFDNMKMSIKNYNALLNSWAQQTLKPNLTLHAGLFEYSDFGEKARMKLIDELGWTISDAGKGVDPMVLIYNTEISTGTTIALPIGGTVDVVVNWGDGHSDTTTDAGVLKHTYAKEGRYVVDINGQLTHFENMGNISNEESRMLVGVSSFGGLGLVSLSGALMNATTFGEIPSKLPESVRDISRLFQGNIWILDSIVNWDVSNITNMDSLFLDTYRVDYDLSGWDISSVKSMKDMFKNKILPSILYDKILNAWSKQLVQSGVIFGAGESQHTSYSLSARNDLVSNKNWIINDGGAGKNPMSLTYNTELSAGSTIGLPLRGDVAVMINWGDGQIEEVKVAGDLLHLYLVEGEYNVGIYGTLSQFGNGSLASPVGIEKLTGATSFGEIGISSLNGAFKNAQNLTTIPSDLPASVNDVSLLFSSLNNFNQDLSSWDTKHVKDMSLMFYNSKAFSQDLSSWNTDSVINMRGMFMNAIAFNQNISTWNTKNVVDMAHMFSNARAFNQEIGSWNTQNVRDMSGMFFNAGSFNQDIGNWKLDSVKSISNMFYNAQVFNQDIGDWNVAAVNDMGQVFNGAIAFNQDISNWNTSKVTNMHGMFTNATSFDQGISKWDVHGVKGMDNMFLGAKLSISNYDDLLISWSKQNVQDSVKFDGGSSQYSFAGKERQWLIDSCFWEIKDAGFLHTSPTSDNFVIKLVQDSKYDFQNNDFTILAVTDTSLSIQITQLPTNGSLKYDGNTVTLDQEISLKNIAKLTFTPAKEKFGKAYDSLEFKVYDGIEYSQDSYSITFDVEEVVVGIEIAKSLQSKLLWDGQIIRLKNYAGLVQIVDALGKVWLEDMSTTGELELHLNAPSGNYWIRLDSEVIPIIK